MFPAQGHDLGIKHQISDRVRLANGFRQEGWVVPAAGVDSGHLLPTLARRPGPSWPAFRRRLREAFTPRPLHEARG